jgi:hypothetical protein
MGEVYRPEDVIHRRERGVSDLGPGNIPKPSTPTDLGNLLQEVRELRIEVEKIKQALKSEGIIIH